MKERIQSAIISFHSRDLETGGWIQRVGRPVVILYLADWTLYHVVNQFGLLQLGQMPAFILGYFLVQLVLGFTLIVLLLRMYLKPVKAAPQDS